MEERVKLKGELNIASLSFQTIEYNNNHHFEIRNRKIHNSFGLILDGSVQFSMLSERFTAHAGDLIFIPEGIRYMSHWDGNPSIRFYNVHFTVPKTNPNPWRTMPPQRIDCKNDSEFRWIYEEIRRLSKGGDTDQLQAYSLFYRLVAKVLPLMEANPTRLPPPQLQEAITYIEEHYDTITSVQEIAAACYLSESRLYHIFKEYLDITPISYRNQLRIHHAMTLLTTTDLSIQQIAERLNFQSEYYFRKTFRKSTGVLPSHFRKML